MSTQRLTLVTAGNGKAILYVYGEDGRTPLSTNQGSKDDLEAYAAEHHPGAPIRHIPPQPVETR